MSHDVLRKAAQAIVKGRCVHVLAQRRAFPVAAYLAYALAQLELRVQLHDGVGGMLNESLRTLESNDVLLVTNTRTIQRCHQCSKAGASARHRKRGCDHRHADLHTWPLVPLPVCRQEMAI